MHIPSRTGASVNAQASPEFVEAQMPLDSTAKASVPSEDTAIPVQDSGGAVVGLHVTPRLVDTQIPPPPTVAAMFIPSPEEATEDQLLLGASLGYQLVPEFVE
jgi:hypothetical protein